MNAKGFTLIETLMVLMLCGVLAAVAGVGIVTGARSFVEAREASELAQEAQLAMDRITREIVELVDVPANSSSTLLVLRNVGAGGTTQVDRSIQYVGGSREIRIADGTGGAANGDTLIDNVTAFSLAYLQQQTGSTTLTSSNSWASSTDSRLLAAVDITFTLTAPGGTSRTFANRIVPRNNENRGGAGEAATPPSLTRYNLCFVATAAAGDTDHPVVVQLREFRDRLLLPWAGGRALVRAYYAVGPEMARVVAASEPLRAAVLAVLTPVAALAGMAVHAPGWLAATLLLSILLVSFTGRAIRRARKAGRETSGAAALPQACAQRGAVLLSAIVTIVAFSVLAATMVPMMTGSMMGGISAVQGDQAYYLAESGFGAAGSMFLAAGSEQARKDLLETMDGSTYALSNNAGSFTLRVEPYWYEVTDNTGATLTTKAYGTPPALPANTTGYIRVGTGSQTYRYSNIAVSGDAVTFTLAATPTPLISRGTDIYFSAQPSAATTVGQRGNLILTTSHAAAFPDVNGMFTIRDATNGHTGNIAYVYRRKSGSTLQDVRLLDGQNVQWSDIRLSATASINLEAYLRLHSTGTPPGGLPREVIYNVPIGWVLGGSKFSKEQYQDMFNTLGAWFTGDASQGHLGTHLAAAADGSLALDITSMATAATSNVAAFVSWLTGSNQWSTLFFNWGVTNANMARAWSDAGGFLSYDLQYKTYAASQNSAQDFFGGVLFRARNTADNRDLECYGISLVRYRMTSLFYGDWYLETDVPAPLVAGYVNDSNPGPLFLSDNNSEIRSTWLGAVRYKYSVPAIMLWERRGGSFKWLAYRALSGSTSNIVTYNPSNKSYRLTNWPTMLVRLVEGQALAFRNGGGGDGAGGVLRINYGDMITTASGAQARVIGPPIVTSGAWSSTSASGLLVLNAIDTTNGNFNNGQAIKVNDVTHATTDTGGLGAKTNYIRIYYSDAGTSVTGNAVPYDDTRRSNPRLTSTDSKLNWIPDDYEQWTSTTDYFTIVQWDAVNTGVSYINERLGDNTDRRTIISTTNLLSPAYNSASPSYSPSEGIAIFTSGPNGGTLFFDDFGLQLDMRSGKGFLPPIQQ